MSDPIVKGIKRQSPRHPAPAHAKHRSIIRSPSAKAMGKRSSSDKAPARKAAKASVATTSKNKAVKKVSTGTRAGKSLSKTTKASTAVKRAIRKPSASKPVKGSRGVLSRSKKSRSSRPARPVAKSPKTTRATKRHKPLAKGIRTARAQPKPTPDVAAALRAFEHAHKEFSRGRFAEARTLFRTIVEKHFGVSEVAARSRTYLAIAEARLRTENALPRDADSLYDRGVIELNRGEYVAAQEMFERALKREPDAAHVHYGLAATRARLGSLELALESLQHALGLQPSLRVRAQHDMDLSTLRNEPDFERLVFTSRF